MSLHLVKLCVGIESFEQLRDSIAERLESKRKSGAIIEQFHRTRMTPRRDKELLAGGSLYWVIKGKIQARQKILNLRGMVDGEGIKRCDIVLEPNLILTQWQPRRAFQGWRYLDGKDAPLDASSHSDGDELPEALKQELNELGLL